MRIELLEEFIELSRDLDFKATAARLHLSPSSFSEHMDKLEREMGFALVTRWPNRALTPQGSRFLKYAHKITRLYAEALRSCASPGSVARQRIRVSCTGMSPRVHDYFFALLAEYGNEHPEVEFVCGEYSKKGGNVRALACEAVDLAFVVRKPDVSLADLERRGVACAVFCREEAGVWLLKSNPLVQKKGLRVDDFDLCSFPLMSGSTYDDFKANVETSFSEVGATPIITPYYASSFEEYLSNAFGEDEMFTATRSFFEDIPAFGLHPERTVVYYDPPVFSPFYLGRRVDERSQAVLDLYGWLLDQAGELDVAGLVGA